MKARNWSAATVQALAVFLTVALIYVASASYGGAGSPFQSRDTLTTAIESWALAVHHTIDVGAHLTPTGQRVLWIVPGAHGTLVSNRFPGAVLIALPLYWIFGGAYSGLPAGLTASLTTAAVVTGMFLLFRRSHSARISVAATAVFAFATANWSVSAKELWEHSGAELMIVLGMLAFARRNWYLSGLAFGAMILFRPHLGVGVAVMAIGLFLIERRSAPVVKFCAAASAGLVGYLAWNYILYGRFTVIGGYSDQVSAGGIGALGFLDNFAGTLMSPERGILICSPVFLLAILGARQGWSRSPRPERLFALAGLAYLVSQLWLIRFSGGSGFLGYRTCLEAMVWASPFLLRCCLAGSRRVPRYVTVGLIAASVSFFATGMFLPSESSGTFNPWTSYGPVELADTFGWSKVVFGAVIGLLGTLVVSTLLSRPVPGLRLGVDPSLKVENCAPLLDYEIEEREPLVAEDLRFGRSLVTDGASKVAPLHES